jgi:hypothetical protein
MAHPLVPLELPRLPTPHAFVVGQQPFLLTLLPRHVFLSVVFRSLASRSEPTVSPAERPPTLSVAGENALSIRVVVVVVERALVLPLSPRGAAILNECSCTP